MSPPPIVSLRNEIWNVDLDLIWEISSTAHAREASPRKDHVLLPGDRLHSIPSQVVLTTWSWLVLVLESMSILKMADEFAASCTGGSSTSKTKPASANTGESKA